MKDDLGPREMAFTNRQLQKCAEREVALRRNVFTKRGMTRERELEIEMMAAIASHFRALTDAEERRPDAEPSPLRT